jgi:transposase, IS5 family
MNSSFGTPSISARMVIGAVIIKHMLNIDDREVVEQIKENIYLQCFTGMSSFTTKAPFYASLMVSIRYRLGQKTMEAFNRLVLQEAGIIPCSENDEGSADDTEGNKDDNNNPASPATGQTIQTEQNNTPANSGTLMMDATVAEQQIEYLTDLKLLNEGGSNWKE